MAARSIATVSMTFGLMSIPTKVYLGASAENFSFNRITPDGNRVKQKLFDAVTDKEVEVSTCSSGYEVEKDKYVIIGKDELESIVEKNNSLQIQEFVDEANFRDVMMEKFYWLTPDKGAERAFRLFSEAISREGKMAIGTWTSRGKDNLVVIRASGDHLMMGQAYYTNEIRSCEYNFSPATAPGPQELELAKMLIDRFTSPKMDLSKYQDQYAERVRALIEAKRNNETMPIAPTAPKAQVLDLLEQLRASLGAAPQQPIAAIKQPSADEVTEAIEGPKPKARKKK